MTEYTNKSTNAVNKNVIIPEVYASLVDEKIKGKVVVAQGAVVLGDLMGQPGETLNIPSWMYTGDAKDITVGSSIPTSKLKQSNKQATIKMVAPDGIAVNDYDDAVAFGRAIEKAAEFQAMGIARKIDADLIEACKKAPQKYKLATKDAVTFDELNKALGVFGDECNADDFEFIAIHSTFVPSMLMMDGFVDVHKTTTASGNGIMTNNLLGYFRGIKVVVSDRLYDAVKSEPFILFIKKDALAIIPKESVHVETARDASTRTTTVYTSQYYAVALSDESGVVIARLTVA